MALSLSKPVSGNLRLGSPCWVRHVWMDRITAILASSPATCVFGLLSTCPCLLGVANPHLQSVASRSKSKAESSLGFDEPLEERKHWSAYWTQYVLNIHTTTKNALLYKTPNLGVSVARPNVLPKLWSIWLPIIKYLTQKLLNSLSLKPRTHRAACLLENSLARKVEYELPGKLKPMNPGSRTSDVHPTTRKTSPGLPEALVHGRKPGLS